MRPKLTLFLLLAITVVAARIDAAEPPANSTAALAPFLNDETVMAVRFDLTQMNVAQAARQWLEPFAGGGMERQVLMVVEREFEKWSDQLKSDGLTHFYLVSTTAYLPDPQVLNRYRDLIPVAILEHTTFAVVPGTGTSKSMICIGHCRRTAEKRGRKAARTFSPIVARFTGRPSSAWAPYSTSWPP